MGSRFTISNEDMRKLSAAYFVVKNEDFSNIRALKTKRECFKEDIILVYELDANLGNVEQCRRKQSYNRGRS